MFSEMNGAASTAPCPGKSSEAGINVMLPHVRTGLPRCLERDFLCHVGISLNPNLGKDGNFVSLVG